MTAAAPRLFCAVEHKGTLWVPQQHRSFSHDEIWFIIIIRSSNVKQQLQSDVGKDNVEACILALARAWKAKRELGCGFDRKTEDLIKACENALYVKKVNAVA
jgi:hypothetical protein